MLTQDWFRMVGQVRNFLNPPLITPSVRAFRLTEDHEIPVLECYEYLQAGVHKRINEIAKNRPSATGNEEFDAGALDSLQRKIGGDDPNLRWALLLHDITKHRDVDEAKFGPHAHTSAEVAKGLTFLNNEPGLSIERIEWLVRYHDVLGNLLTGEQRPEELWNALGVGNWKELDDAANVKLGLLQIMTFCDMWGTLGGRFLTMEKLHFWLRVREKIEEFESFAEYRISRWTGDEDMTPDTPRRKAVLKKLGDTTTGIFSHNVGRIAQGFYLFVAIAKDKGPDVLAELLNQIATFYSNITPVPKVIHLQFDRYRRDSNLEHVLDRYANAKFGFFWDDRRSVLYVSSSQD